MSNRVRRARRVQGLAIGGTFLLGSLWAGWWLAALVALSVAVLAVLESATVRASTRPELGGAAGVVALQLLIAAGVAGSGGATSPYLAFLVVPTIMLAARFRLVVVVAGVVGTAVLTALAGAAAVALPPAPAVPSWLHLVALLALLASVAAASITLLTAEVQHRGEASVDPLTGLFNRNALDGRFEEVRDQAEVLDAPVAVVMADLDHFKLINDRYGHGRGDVVLRGVAQRLRRSLRTFDLVYRLGGEEFMVLLPGLDAEEAAVLAQRVVDDIAARPIGRLRITMSAGVAAGRGRDLTLEDLSQRADEALYRAKDAGRNRVAVDPASGRSLRA